MKLYPSGVWTDWEDIPWQSRLFAVLATAHIGFALLFPYISVPLIKWIEPRGLLDIFIIVFSMPFVFIFIYFAVRRWPLLKRDRKLLVVAAALLYIAVYFSLPDRRERLHIISFSVMGIFLYKFFSPLMPLKKATLRALFLTIFIACFDEWLQQGIEGRTSTLHDAFLGVKGALLGVGISWIFDKYSRKGRTST